MPTINHLRAAVAGAVLTAHAATACDTAAAGPEGGLGVSEPVEEMTRLYPPTKGCRRYPPTDPVRGVPAAGAGE